MAIIYSKKYKTDNRREVLNPTIEQGLRKRYGLADISKRLEEIKQRALGIQSKLGTLREAEKAGMTITPKTSVEEARQFLKPKPQPEPKVGYIQPTQPKVDYIQPPQIQMPEPPKTDIFGKLKDFLTGLLPTQPKVEVPDITAKSKALADVQKEIADTEKKYLLTAEKWRNEAMAKGLTMPYLKGKLGQLERQRDIEMASLYAKQRALQGDLANAQKLAQYAADLAQNDFNNKLKIVNLALEEASREASSAQKQYIEALRNQFDLYKQQMNKVYQLMVQYPDAGILPSDDWRTIQDKIKQSALYRKKTTISTERPQSIRKNIISDINRAVDQYRLNPEGFRERFIESLVATYGEPYRDYIVKQVYSLMPDIVSGKKSKEESEEISWEDLEGESSKESWWEKLKKKF